MTQPPVPPAPNYSAPTLTPDENHLKILAICWFVWSGLSGLCCSCAGLYYIFVGGMFSAAAAGSGAAGIGAIPMVMGGCGVVLALVLAGLGVWVGLNLNKRQNYTYCLVMSFIICLNIPLGTVLGVFTIIVLNRPSVKALFGRA